MLQKPRKNLKSPCLLLAACLAALLTIAANGQTAPGLQLKVLRGNNAFNNLGTKTATPVTVMVTAPDGRPIPGAAVLFQSSDTRPTVKFGGTNVTSASTDLSGIATSAVAVPDGEGIVRINVTAASGPNTAVATVTQRNYQPLIDKAQPDQAITDVRVPTAREVLSIEAVTKDNETNVIDRDEKKLLSVRVSINGNGVGGVTVDYRVSPGPGVFFYPDIAPTARVVSDDKGMATVTYTPNSTPGSFLVHVRAETMDHLVATADLKQTNSTAVN